MTDQAERLRKIIDNIKLKQTTGYTECSSRPSARKARIIAVTSGKGGVGKSNITINLAVALSEMQQRVIILDADFGLSNIDILFGITPEHTLVDVIHKRKNILQVLSEGPNNIRFISGGSGVEELVKLDRDGLLDFIEHIKLLDRFADIIFIDTGAGIAENVINFLLAADEIILVVTPEPTSITDAYALIKLLSNKNLKTTIKLIVNRAESVKEAGDILNKLTMVAKKFLNVTLFPLGYVLQDDNVIKAVKLQQPFYICFPKSHASRNIQEISQKLLDVDIRSQNTGGLKGFFNKLLEIIK